MRCERLWSTGRRIWDWPLEFQYLCFLEAACAHRRLAPRTDLQPLWTFASKRSWLSDVASDYCARQAHRSHHRFWTEGMILVRLVRDDCRLVSQVRLRSAALCGKGDYCVLSVCSATQYSGLQEHPEEWQLTLTRRAGKAPDQVQNYSAQVKCGI